MGLFLYADVYHRTVLPIDLPILSFVHFEADAAHLLNNSLPQLFNSF